MNLIFEWDEEKRQTVIETRQVDMLYAALIFDHPILIARDKRQDYGEERYIALGHVEEEFFYLVYTPVKENVIRLITAWKAGKHGEKKYKEHFS